jgi:hypothetical protein
MPEYKLLGSVTSNVENKLSEPVYTPRGMVLCMAQSDKNTVGDSILSFLNPES